MSLDADTRFRASPFGRCLPRFRDAGDGVGRHRHVRQPRRLRRQRDVAISFEVLSQQLDHVAWRGGVFWDLIQPSFMFMVGVAMPFSYASRRARGDSWLRLFGHAVLRSLVLIALAVFLASNGSPHTNFSFTNVLGQIGLGYPFVFLLLGRRPAVQFAAAIAILVAYWLLFALYPLPGPDFPIRHVRRQRAAAHHDRLLRPLEQERQCRRRVRSLVPQPVPSPGRSPLPLQSRGLCDPELHPLDRDHDLRSAGRRAAPLEPWPRSAKLQVLLLAGAVCWVAGPVLDATVCPIVKRIWTPSWVIASTAWTCWMLAAFYCVIDVAGFRRWSFPLVVVGMNSIAIYLMAQLMKPFVARLAAHPLRPGHLRRAVWTARPRALHPGSCSG